MVRDPAYCVVPFDTIQRVLFAVRGACIVEFLLFVECYRSEGKCNSLEQAQLYTRVSVAIIPG